MQFFSKINEIVGQLSGTVERSETALEQATVALAEASAAVTEANIASAAASSAAQTVAGYNTRLAAAESGVAANTANIGQLDIETQDLYDRDANSVKLSSDHPQNVVMGLRSAVVPSVDEDYVNMKYVESTNAGDNNLVHKTGGEYLEHQSNGRRYINTTSSSARWRELYRWSGRFIGVVRVMSTRVQVNDIVLYGRDERYLKWGSEHYTESELNPRIYINEDGSFRYGSRSDTPIPPLLNC